MKKDKIIFWIATGLIFLFEGVMPAFTGHTEMAKQGISHLGFPDYFRVYLNVCKILGVLAIVVPFVPSRIKEWAYFGTFIIYIGAIASHIAVGDGLNKIIFPVIMLLITITSWALRPDSRKLSRV